MADSSAKRWFAVVAVDGTPADEPPLGEKLTEQVQSLAASPASSSWTTWTTGIPPNTQTDGGWEIDV